jgi:hypothetical protein
MNIEINGKINKHNNLPFPPTLGALVTINHPKYDDNLFLGFVYKYLWNMKACLILLFNNLDYSEKLLVDHKILKNDISAKGTFLLHPSYGWRYVNLSKLQKANDLTSKQIEDLILNRKTEFESSTIVNDYPVTQLDLTTHGLFKNSETKEKDCDMNDKFKDESLLTEKGELSLDALFREGDIDIYDPNEKFRPIDEETQLLLQKKLRIAERVSDKEMKIIVNKNIAVRNIIDTKEDEINEGNKIIKWLMEHMSNMKTNGVRIFGDMKMAIHNGYVHIGRKGIKVTDKITTDNVGELNYFKWQYGIPIDYDALKYILFQTGVQKKMIHDVAQQKETEKILSQEYLICLHPESKYLMFSLKRLLIAWYSDDILTKHIRKIKVLINQWRGKPDEAFNKKYGVLPMIVVYPKYGKNSARICITKIADYFTLYNNIAWKCSEPSYFIKINDLMYYTNGNLDLKLYYRTVLSAHNGNIVNTSFDAELHKVVGAENLLYPYSDENQ